jgi:hypothetical protein
MGHRTIPPRFSLVIRIVREQAGQFSTELYFEPIDVLLVRCFQL